jgi:hypothetical protein
MKLGLALYTCGLSLPLLAGVEEKNTIQKTFAIARPETARVEVDNMTGPIRVTGYDGSEVQATVRQTIEADSKEKLEEARRDVKLDMTEQGGTVRFYVDGPFRCHCSDGQGYRGDHDRGYNVRYDFEIRAPRQSSVFLRTVNDGDIHVAGIGGDYDVKNINGGVELLDAGGSGKVYALNGGVKATFVRNPRADSYFGSLNGQVDLFFQPSLSAELAMKTFNGNIYTDFDVTSLPSRPGTAERRGAKFVYRADRFTHARVGAGGPEIKLDGFNGDIRILKRP